MFLQFLVTFIALGWVNITIRVYWRLILKRYFRRSFWSWRHYLFRWFGCLMNFKSISIYNFLHPIILHQLHLSLFLQEVYFLLKAWEIIVDMLQLLFQVYSTPLLILNFFSLILQFHILFPNYFGSLTHFTIEMDTLLSHFVLIVISWFVKHTLLMQLLLKTFNLFVSLKLQVMIQILLLL